MWVLWLTFSKQFGMCLPPVDILDLENHYGVMRTFRHLLLSGFVGLLVPVFAFTLSIISRYVVAEFLASIVYPAVMLIEPPAVTLGRLLRLPIDTGVTAFFSFQLTPFGYLWIVLSYAVAGVAAGSISDDQW